MLLFIDIYEVKAPPKQTFKYISCYCSYAEVLDYGCGLGHLNTSHVIVHQRNFNTIISLTIATKFKFHTFK